MRLGAEQFTLTRRKLLECVGSIVALGAVPTALTQDKQEPLVVGSTATGAPFSFLDLKTGKLAGLMIDVISALAEQARLSVRIQTIAFSALIPSLLTRKIDIVSAGMLKTP